MAAARVVAAVLALSALLAAGLPADAGGGKPLFVKKFLLGYRDPDTRRFTATGGRGIDNAYRDNVILLHFSAAVELDTVSSRTVEIGIPGSGGRLIEAEGTLRYHEIRRFNPITGTYELKRIFRNRVIFDPLKSDMPAFLQNPEGFKADTLYTVKVPGVDGGATNTVESRSGHPQALTFATTFRTTTEYLGYR